MHPTVVISNMLHLVFTLMLFTIENLSLSILQSGNNGRPIVLDGFVLHLVPKIFVKLTISLLD